MEAGDALERVELLLELRAVEQRQRIDIGDCINVTDWHVGIATGKNSAGIVWHIQRFIKLVQCPSCGEEHEEVWVN